MPPDRDPERRAKIVRAATTLFSRYGVRRTSMDLLAREAEVAKPTLYAYFADKRAVFAAVVDHVLTEIAEAARRAAATTQPVEARLTEVLAAKFTHLFELVESSPHAAELLDSSDAHARARVAKADADYRGVLTRLVHDAEAAGELDVARAGTTVRSFVDALLRAGHGAGWHADSATEHRRQLANLVRLLVAAVGAR